jgi:5-methylcytosine-specific restriction endonuclease McrA
MNKRKVQVGRKMALNRLKKLGICENSSGLGHIEILRLLFENNLCGVNKPSFSKKEASNEFVRIANEAPLIIGGEKLYRKFNGISRKIKSTLSCPTNKDNQIVKTINTDSKPNPIGYKSRCRKNETFDLTPETFYKSWRWKEIRLIALDACGRRCVSCGATPSPNNRVVLHVDHIKPLRFHQELALDLSNLQVLCEDCNQGKSWFNTKDYRTDEQKQDMKSKQMDSLKVTEEAIANMHNSMAK